MSDEYKTRKTDSPLNDPVQSSRFVEIDGNWFFLTREKELQGPYASKMGAETALDIYLKEDVAGASKPAAEKLENYGVEEIDVTEANTNVIPLRDARSTSNE